MRSVRVSRYASTPGLSNSDAGPQGTGDRQTEQRGFRLPAPSNDGCRANRKGCPGLQTPFSLAKTGVITYILYLSYNYSGGKHFRQRRGGEARATAGVADKGRT